MKRLAALTLALVSTLANAEVVKLLDVTMPVSSHAVTRSFAQFYMDQQTGEGYAKVSVSELPASSDDIDTVVYNKTVKIENLVLMGDQMVFLGANGNVDCGTLGVSRIFKRPTLNLTGNCSLKTKSLGNSLEVFFVTK